MSQQTINLKFVIVGNSGVGKTRLLIRYVDNTFTTAFYNTIGVDFKMKQIVIDNKKIRMQIWDTAGQERYRTITSSIYKRAHGIMIVYDVTDRESFEALKGWQAEAEKNIDEDVVFMIIGNKTDKAADRQVSKEQAKEYVSVNKFLHMEVSAMSDHHVKEAFELLAKTIITKMESKQKQQIASKKQKQKQRQEQIIKLDEKPRLQSGQSQSQSNGEIGKRRSTGSQFQCSC